MRIGIDLGGTTVKAALCTEDGTLLCKDSLPTRTGNAAGLKTDMKTLALSLCRAHSCAVEDVTAIGIGVPGSFDKKTCTLRFGTNLGLNNVSFADAFLPEFGCPVHLDNDANCAALGEATAGAAKGTRNMLMVTLGTGVGGGIIINGQLYTGCNGIAGEIGHMVIRKDGEPCNCGRRGCLEAYCSAASLVRFAERALEDGRKSVLAVHKGQLNAKQICDAVDAGDALAQELFDEYCGNLANGLASFVNLFQPESIVLGGGLAGSAAAYTLAKAGVKVIVIERGETCGCKNMTGGRLYGHSLKRLIPDYEKLAPLERRIIKERVSLMSSDSATTVEFCDEKLGGRNAASYSVIRADLDKWLAEQAEKKGATYINGIRVDELVVRNGKVCGVRAGEDTLEANVVILADGVNSLLAVKAGLVEHQDSREYAVGAKEVIRLINGVANVVNNDPRVNELIEVCFIPNFAISNAQLIYPAAEISEQISTAGKEASGTSNMKLMMNGAITLGTMDGANIEIVKFAGEENEMIFGLTTDEVNELRANGQYFAWDIVNNDRSRLGRIIDELVDGTFAAQSGNFESIHHELMFNNDHDLVLRDFHSYVDAWERLTATYCDAESWSRRSLHNTAMSGWFSSDRTIREYCDEIWHV